MARELKGPPSSYITKVPRKYRGIVRDQPVDDLNDLYPRYRDEYVEYSCLRCGKISHHHNAWVRKFCERCAELPKYIRHRYLNAASKHMLDEKKRREFMAHEKTGPIRHGSAHGKIGKRKCAGCGTYFQPPRKRQQYCCWGCWRWRGGNKDKWNAALVAYREKCKRKNVVKKESPRGAMIPPVFPRALGMHENPMGVFEEAIYSLLSLKGPGGENL